LGCSPTNCSRTTDHERTGQEASTDPPHHGASTDQNRRPLAGTALPDVEPRPPPDDVSALLRSLGNPTLAGGSSLASYFSAVVERAASIATALILSTELPAAPPEDKTSDPSD
jgi:hypothetical protein